MATITQSIEGGTRTHRISVDQYLRMIVVGTFPDSARLELLDGNIVRHMTKYPPNDFTVGRTARLLGQALPIRWIIREEKSLVLGRFWRPEPDVAVIKGPDDLYRARDPKKADVGFLVEVAEATYDSDRGQKWRAYAAARIPIYWIVNLNRRQVEVYTDPTGRGRSASYREAATFGPEDEVPIVIDGQEIGRLAVRDILP